jgi:hypothetical protein
MKQKVRHVAFGSISRTSQTTIYDNGFLSDMNCALDPHRPVTRYRREWRVSRPRVLGSDYLTAKLGFVRVRESEGVHYDERLEDFVTDVSPLEEGSFTQFVVGLADGLLAFEIRPPDIRTYSFVGAFQQLLKESGCSLRFQVEREEVNFESWLKRMERITMFDGVARVPNPSYSRRAKAIQEVIEETNAAQVEVKAKARDNETLVLDDTLLDAIAAHVEVGEERERNYGSVSADGILGDDKSSFRHGLVEARADITENESDTSTTISRKLVTVLTKFRKTHHG